MSETFTATVEGTSYQIRSESEHKVIVDGSVHECNFVALDDRSYSLVLDGKTYLVDQLAARSVEEERKSDSGDPGNTVGIGICGKSYIARVDDQRSLLLRSLLVEPPAPVGPKVIKAPMPGLISRIEVQIGEEVTSGKGLLVLEAMKMENEIRSVKHGRVQLIHVTIGTVVEKDDPLVTVEEL
ncbi:MAG: hypothetical protein NTU47_18075 [Ignavibacteriales bacterium]|nr:hypothetical protein [Ignavibacteriales bacterium]